MPQTIEVFEEGDGTLFKGKLAQKNTRVITAESPYCYELLLLFLKCMEIC